MNTQRELSLFVNWWILPATPGRYLGIEEVEFDTEGELRAFLTGVDMTLGYDRFISGKSIDEVKRQMRRRPRRAASPALGEENGR